MHYLLDTNALSEPAKAQPSEELMQRLADSWEDICTAAPVWHELLYTSKELTRKRRQFQQTNTSRPGHAPTSLLPSRTVEYIVPHEVEHLREPPQSGVLAAVGAALPDYADRKRWLAENARAFELWRLDDDSSTP